jgi:hypothetical protein
MKFPSALFPKEWLKENAAYVQKVFSPMTLVPRENTQHQAQAVLN